MSPAPRRRWARFMAGVRKHEETHGQIARQMVDAAEKSLSDISLHNDPRCRKTQAELKKRIAVIYAKYEARQIEFDRGRARRGRQCRTAGDAARQGQVNCEWRLVNSAGSASPCSRASHSCSVLAVQRCRRLCILLRRGAAEQRELDQHRQMVGADGLERLCRQDHDIALGEDLVDRQAGIGPQCVGQPAASQLGPIPATWVEPASCFDPSRRRRSRWRR